METYRLLIVDDEIEVCEGLKIFDFSSLGIELVGYCCNGLDALQSIIQNPVDIVLTDIRMPLMNGLELTERLKREFPFIKIIILSGFDDFEYTKKCIQNGVVDYLLKPLDFNDLHRALWGTVDLLNKEKQKKREEVVLRQKAQLATKTLRKVFLRNLLQHSLAPYEIEEGSIASELTFENEYYTICLLWLDSFSENEHKYSKKEQELIVFAIENVVNELWDEKSYGYHYVDNKSMGCYLIATNYDLKNSGNSEDCKFKLNIIMEEIRKELYKLKGLLKSIISIGIGNSVKDLRDLPVSRLQAEKLIQSADATANSNFSSEFTHGSNNENFIIQEKISPDILKMDSESCRKVIEEAKCFIMENYNQIITLEDVAHHVYINPSYLSVLFQNITGVKYIHYLTDYRISKAKLLLGDLQYKVYEIGEMVGYCNPRYFATIFKKYTGMTPFKYRDSIKDA